MKEKYVEERFPRYFVWGTSESGKVDVASTQHDTLTTVTVEDADRIIADRDAVIDMLVRLAQALDEENPELFGCIWYGGEIKKNTISATVTARLIRNQI